MSIEDVARQAGVSVATVSRAINLPGMVTPATRERVQAVAKRLGYQPNSSARTLRTQRSQVLGVVLPTLLNPVFAECLDGIAHAASAAGYSIVPLTTDYQLDAELHAVERMLASNVDGLILVVSQPATSAALRKLIAARVPYVLAYNRHRAHPCVSVDGELAVAELVERLVAMGHRRIAMVSGQLSASDRAQQRHRGFVQGMKDAGLVPAPLIEVPFVETAVGQLRHALCMTPRPTALVCSNDLLAIRSIRAAHLCGLRVPDDLSVIGFDGIALGEDLSPMLGTVAQPNHQIGSQCALLLTSSLAAGKPLLPSASLTLAHTFRAGESCGAPADANPSLSIHPRRSKP